MAVTFIKGLSTTDLLSAYNNNIVIFYSSLTNVTHATIEMGAFNLKIYPYTDISGVSVAGSFWFNFKTLFSKLINENNFADDIEPAYLYTGKKATIDNDLFLNETITFTVYNSTSNQTIDVTIDMLKNVVDYKAEYPSDGLSKITQFDKVSYFEGFPFDVSFWASATASTYSIVRDGSTINESLVKGINRMFLDDGDESITIVDYCSVTYSLTSIRWDLKHYDCDGVYLKWYNPLGGWMYFLFNQKYKETTSAKSLGKLYNDFENPEDTISPSVSMGKEVGKIQMLHATGIEQFEIDIINTIIGSPKVYLYMGTKGTTATTDDWLEVELKTTSLVTENYGRLKFNTSISIDIPQTQMIL